MTRDRVTRAGHKDARICLRSLRPGHNVTARALSLLPRTSPAPMRFRPTLLALAISLTAVGAAASAQTAAPAGKPATATQPAMPARPTAAKPAAVAKPSAATAATPAAAAKPATAAKSEPVDINTASKTDLQTIPGIGDVYASKIIAGRPYHSKDELTRKKILPAGVYAKTKDRLVARQH